MRKQPRRPDPVDDDQRIPLIVVAGLREDHVDATAEAVRAREPAGTALVHHDLRRITRGVVRRIVRHGGTEHVTPLELAHGCVACTLREDLLPLLRRLCKAPDVGRIVVRLDPALEPEVICWAIRHVLVDDRPLVDDVHVQAVLTALDLPSWLSEASGDEALAERGMAAAQEDERTVAQVAVGQVEFADAVVLAGDAQGSWDTVRTAAVIDRLAPLAPCARLDALDVDELLARIPAEARRGAVDGAHGPLLRGQPPLDTDAGVATVLFEERRPFHPQRLHDAFDVLLEGTVRVRGRVWVASQPETVLWIESAGGGLGIGHAGPWLAALADHDWEDVDVERRLRASLDWDHHYGDRVQEVVVIAHEADPREITRALRGALLTDDELAAGEAAWADYADPFGEWHVEPCAEPSDTDETAETDHDNANP